MSDHILLSLSLSVIILVQRAGASALHFRVAQSVRVRMLNLSAAIEDISLHTVNIQVAQLQAVTALPCIKHTYCRSGPAGSGCWPCWRRPPSAWSTCRYSTLVVVVVSGVGGFSCDDRGLVWADPLKVHCILYYSSTGAECHLAGENPYIH